MMRGSQIREICLVLLALLTGLHTTAQVQRTFVNMGFEQPQINLPPYNSGTFIQTNHNNVPGWVTSATDFKIEIWRSGFLGVPSHSGSQHAELNATQPSKLSQTVCVLSGEDFNWSFWHRGRSGIDTLRCLINGVEQGRFGTGTSIWKNYSGHWIAPADANVAFEFQAIYATGGLSVGNFLDEITIIPPLKPFIEMDAATHGDNEANGGDIPKILIVGDVPAHQSVDVVITGGTATLGSDFNFTSTVAIPQGTYDGTPATGVPINLSIIDDLVSEPNETIHFVLRNPTSGLLMRDMLVCNAFADSVTTYVIYDDEPLASGQLFLQSQADANRREVALTLTTDANIIFDQVRWMRSDNGSDFIAFDSTLHPHSQTAFSALDELPAAGSTRFYRADLVGVDGSVLSSNLEIIRVIEEKATLNVFPNPSSGLLYLQQQGNVSGTYELELWQPDGRNLFSWEMLRPAAWEVMTLELPEGFPNGLYVMRIKHLESGTVSARRLLIQR